MDAHRSNRISGKLIIVLSVTALLTVISGYFSAPLPDEGAAAHIFQIVVVLLVPAIVVFLATADWRRPWRSTRPLRIPSVVLAVAFSALYYLEHYR